MIFSFKLRNQIIQNALQALLAAQPAFGYFVVAGLQVICYTRRAAKFLSGSCIHQRPVFLLFRNTVSISVKAIWNSRNDSLSVSCAFFFTERPSIKYHSIWRDLFGGKVVPVFFRKVAVDAA